MIDATSLEILREERKSKFAIASVSLTAENDKLGACIADGTVLICSFDTLQTIHSVNLRFSRPATLVDFNRDGSLLRIEHEPDRLSYFDLQTMQDIRDVSHVSQEVWQSKTWKFSWETQGIFTVHESRLC